MGGLRLSAPRQEVKGGAPAAHPPATPTALGPLHPRQEAWHICTPPCTLWRRHLAFRYGAGGGGRLRTDGPGSSGVAGDGAPRPCCRKPGPWLRAGTSALPPAPAPNTSSKRARQLHERPAAPAGCWLFFRPAIKLVNTWTRLTKHSSRRKWGVCRNTPLHIVMADINSMLITLCTFQSHILNPFR